MKNLHSLLCLFVLTLFSQARGEIYKCMEEGRTIYADSPCGESAEKIDVSASAEKTGTQFSNEEIDALGYQLGNQRRSKELERDIVSTQEAIDNLIDDYTARKTRLEAELAEHRSRSYRHNWQHSHYKRDNYYEKKRFLQNQLKAADREFKAAREKAYNKLASLRRQRKRLD